MMPADKASVIQDLQRQGAVVAMVGDGINDSPALSFADVGIAMKYGAEVAQESADVVLMEDSLWKLVKAVEISRGAVGLIKQNYGIVAALNTIALGLALPGGLISPASTALLSNGSAILASVNGIRPMLAAQLTMASNELDAQRGRRSGAGSGGRRAGTAAGSWRAARRICRRARSTGLSD